MTVQEWGRGVGDRGWGCCLFRLFCWWCTCVLAAVSKVKTVAVSVRMLLLLHIFIIEMKRHLYIYTVITSSWYEGACASDAAGPGDVHSHDGHLQRVGSVARRQRYSGMERDCVQPLHFCECVACRWRGGLNTTIEGDRCFSLLSLSVDGDNRIIGY